MEKPGAIDGRASRVANHFDHGPLKPSISISAVRGESIDGKAIGFAKTVADDQRSPCRNGIASVHAKRTAGIGGVYSNSQFGRISWSRLSFSTPAASFCSARMPIIAALSVERDLSASRRF